MPGGSRRRGAYHGIFVYSDERIVASMGTYCTKERSARDTRRGGFTLIELMVYIGIVGIIVIVAGQAFSNSTKMRVRTQSMLKASEVAENVALILKDDVAQMGAKSAKETGAVAGGDFGDAFSDVYADVYMDPDNATETSKDSSSFTITDLNGFDSLAIRRLRYDASGHYAGVEQVSWFVKNGTLWRNCKVLQKKADLPEGDPCSDGAASVPTDMEVATGVTEFSVVPSKPGAVGDEIQVFPNTGETEFRLVPRTDEKFMSVSVVNGSGQIAHGGTSQTLTGFFSNYNSSAEAIVSEDNRKANELIAIRNLTTTETSWKSLCQNYGKLTLNAGEEYEISFEVPYPGTTKDNSMMFVPGVDHMSVGIRSYETGDVPKVDGVSQVDDFLFFPPLDAGGGGKRSMRFSVPSTVENVCVAFTFACYSPLVSQGMVTISNLKVVKVPGATYDFSGFDAESHKNDKQNIKAFQLNLKVERNGESGNVTLVIPTPSNGPSD